MSHPLTLIDLQVWRAEVKQDVTDAEYELAKARAMLAWIDAEIRNLEAE